MKKRRMMLTVAAGAMSAVMALGLTACSGSDASSEADEGPVAATVNGEPIYEQTVTDYIASIRGQMGLSEDDAWGEWLVSYGYTPETIRSDVIDSYATRELMIQGADEKGITVDASEIDEYVNSIKQYYDTDEEWEQALSDAGMDEEYYRNEIEIQLKSEALQESFATDEEPAEEDVLEYCQMYAQSYDGARRSSNILFNVDDQETAQEVLDKINAGELDFAEAAKEYSNDTASKESGGDVGWDATSQFVDEYQAALDELEKDQVSGLVESEYGWHIIKCTDIFSAPEEVTSTDQLPSEWVDEIKESLKSQSQSKAFNAWLEEYRESAEIVVNDMPEGLPYDIDLTPYEEAAAEEDAAADESTDTATDVDTTSAEGEAAAEEEPAEGDAAEGDAATSDTAAEDDTDTTADTADSTDSTSEENTASQQPTEQ